LTPLACGGASAPTEPQIPPPPAYPSWLGEWSGTIIDTWSGADGSVTGFRYCNANWLITSQNGPTFAGNFQGTPGTVGTPGTLSECARSGVLDGQLRELRNVTINETGPGVMKNCVHLESPDTTIRGVASEPGKFRGVAILLLRCPLGGGTIDYRFAHAVDMTRR
jgi:hypothetical protein